MQISVTISGLGRLFGEDLGAVLDVARVADEVGVHQIVLPDHLAIGPRTDRYPFADRFPYPPEEPWLEPMTALAAMAGVTERVRLATGILIAPLRPALVLARTAATLDVLSRGRLDLGVGVGWQPEEFTTPGLAFRGRAARMDDALRACRALWESAPPVSFTSSTTSFTDLWCEPRPHQSRLPVWFAGGASAATARRIAELGDGWLPLGLDDDALATGIARLRDAFAGAGRDPDAVQVRAPLPVAVDAGGRHDLTPTRARAEVLGALGVTLGSVALGRFVRDPGDVEPFLRDVVAAFA